MLAAANLCSQPRAFVRVAHVYARSSQLQFLDRRAKMDSDPADRPAGGMGAAPSAAPRVLAGSLRNVNDPGFLPVTPSASPSESARPGRPAIDTRCEQTENEFLS